MSLEFILGLVAVLFIIMYVYSRYSRENYRMYFGMGVTPLDDECPAPFCGGNPPSSDEDENYPFLINSSGSDGNDTGLQKELNMFLDTSKTDTRESVKAAGYDLLNNNLIYPDSDIKETINKIAQNGGLKELTMATSTGMQKAETFSVNGFQKIGNHVGPESFSTNSFQKIGSHLGNIAEGFSTNGFQMIGSHIDPESFSPMESAHNFQRIGNHTGNGQEYFSPSESAHNFQKIGSHTKSTERFSPSESAHNFQRIGRFESNNDIVNGVENFMQAPSAITYAPAGSYIYEHPDMDGFNDAIYSNPGRTIGIADPQQAVIHFNESAAYYGNVQETLPVSKDSARWNDQYNPQIGTADYFDISEQYSMPMDDPKQPIATVDYASRGTGAVYKKRTNVNDAIDEMNRKRNDLLIGAAERGERVSKDSRNIMNVVFSPDMDRYEKSVWYSHYEV